MEKSRLASHRKPATLEMPDGKRIALLPSTTEVRSKNVVARAMRVSQRAGALLARALTPKSAPKSTFDAEGRVTSQPVPLRDATVERANPDYRRARGGLEGEHELPRVTSYIGLLAASIPSKPGFIQRVAGYGLLEGPRVGRPRSRDFVSHWLTARIDHASGAPAEQFRVSHSESSTGHQGISDIDVYQPDGQSYKVRLLRDGYTDSRNTQTHMLVTDNRGRSYSSNPEVFGLSYDRPQAQQMHHLEAAGLVENALRDLQHSPLSAVRPDPTP